MAGVASKFVSTSYTKKFLKSAKGAYKKIHEATGKVIRLKDKDAQIGKKGK